MSGAVLARVRLVIPAGAAKPAPPVGPALGQHGLNIMSFCKDFNAKTSNFMADTPIPVALTAFKDKTFEWTMKSPPASYFIKKAAGVGLGSARPGHGAKGTITLKHVYQIARVKQSDEGFEFLTDKAVCLSIMSTAKSMGVSIIAGRQEPTSDGKAV
mmetsp:Transcript_21621/g.53606  ORF Transcript_21621/g.53606 Transcript_21621/m.53606 type:complete len:157 (+) Transcript_21621:137-607(+)|eukprot:CAMPEP_0197577600 /NCGR_PEP_ID=MMETSP1326-20131121/2171_1 /TAXON_ID=1155430 /ORGANISM="Genus nov. species nov., Strain RCC2288" /LENGTH=156 /DNA_ID=CAMNT_0043140695 /DNA_START=137 /DNA_END=607 /DNA_ORIENTATION=+